MEHDGPQDGNSCNSDDFVMSPTLGAGKTTWSSCSREYLEKFLRSSQANCVLAPSSNTNILHQFHKTNLLPGQIFDADRQCVLRFGSTSRKSQLQPLEDICRLLRCDTGPKRNTVVYHAHPALEGTTCGNKKVCKLILTREGKVYFLIKLLTNGIKIILFILPSLYPNPVVYSGQLRKRVTSTTIAIS